MENSQTSNIIYGKLYTPTKQEKQNLKTFCLINTGYALSKQQRKDFVIFFWNLCYQTAAENKIYAKFYEKTW